MYAVHSIYMLARGVFENPHFYMELFSFTLYYNQSQFYFSLRTVFALTRSNLSVVYLLNN